MPRDVDALLDAGVRAIVEAVHSGDAEPVELAEAALRRAEDAPANALLAVDGDVAIAAARRLSERLAAGERPPLAGVPVAHKDLFDTADFSTTYGNPAFARRPDADATAVARTVAAGALQVGKANLHELAYGVTGVNARAGTPVNPLGAELIPGGSSSGSGVLVAAGTVACSLGTDTGGSVRIPAACCGVLGLKTTRGAVPTTGVQALSAMQDTVGPIARSAGDAGLLLRVVAGPDGQDPVAATPPDGWEPGELRAIAGLVLLRPVEIWERRIHPGVRRELDAALTSLADAGVEVRDVSLPGIADARRAQATVLAAHALAVHEATLAERPEVFGDDIRIRLEAAREITGAELANALETRRRWIAEVNGVLGAVGGAAAGGGLAGGGTLIVSPTLAFPPPTVETTTITWDDGGDEDVTPALTRLTGIWNLAGLPAVAVPVGEAAPGVPASLQMIGAPWTEPSLLSAAAVVEGL